MTRAIVAFVFLIAFAVLAAWIADRPWLVPPMPLVGSPRSPIDPQHQLRLDLRLPCWNRPLTAECAVPSDQACRRWACPADAGPADATTYIDPACQRIHDTFELEPLLVKQPRGD